jgi:hypothetical protein
MRVACTSSCCCRAAAGSPVAPGSAVTLATRILRSLRLSLRGPCTLLLLPLLLLKGMLLLLLLLQAHMPLQVSCVILKAVQMS